MPGCFEFALQIKIQNTSISHARRQTFNGEPNFVKLPQLCTIQNASNFQAKITSEHLFYRTASVAPVKVQLFFKKGKKQKQFLILPLCLTRLKYCNCIKIGRIVFIHNFEKNYSNLSSVSFKFCNIKYRSSHKRCSIKKVFLEISQNSQENTCAWVSFLRTFFAEHLWTTASQNTKTTFPAGTATL